jgi:TRAP-type C4-dicarboxylate transport system permease small subunit
MTSPVRRICQIIIGIGGGLVFALIAVLGAERTLSEYASGMIQGGIIPWPLWPSVIFVPIGAGMIAIRLALHAIAHAVSLVKRVDLIPLPPLAGTSDAPVRFE